jgi:hypothetical protein
VLSLLIGLEINSWVASKLKDRYVDRQHSDFPLALSIDAGLHQCKSKVL